MFRLPIVKFFSRILNRITITVVLVALQVAWLLWAFFSLTTGRVWVNAGLQLLSLFMMLYLVRKDENSAYKIGWIALMGCCRCWAGHCTSPLATSARPSSCAASCRRWTRPTGLILSSSRARPTGWMLPASA